MNMLCVSGGSPTCFPGVYMHSSCGEIGAHLEFIFHSGFSQMESSFLSSMNAL